METLLAEGPIKRLRTCADELYFGAPIVTVVEPIRQATAEVRQRPMVCIRRNDRGGLGAVVGDRRGSPPTPSGGESKSPRSDSSPTTQWAGSRTTAPCRESTLPTDHPAKHSRSHRRSRRHCVEWRVDLPLDVTIDEHGGVPPALSPNVPALCSDRVLCRQPLTRRRDRSQRPSDLADLPIRDLFESDHAANRSVGRTVDWARFASPPPWSPAGQGRWCRCGSYGRHGTRPNGQATTRIGRTCSVAGRQMARGTKG